MKYDYAFFKNELGRERKYRIKFQGYTSFLDANPHVKKKIKIVEDAKDYMDVRVKHLMNPPCASVKRIEDEFDVKLPADFTAFYNNWDGGILLLREHYSIQSIDQIIKVTYEFRRVHNIPKDAPLNVVRFCERYDMHYLALRKKDDTWDIVWADIGDSEEELLSDSPYIAWIDKSFYAWLKRMIVTDGYPCTKSGKTGYDLDEAQADRLD